MQEIVSPHRCRSSAPMRGCEFPMRGPMGLVKVVYAEVQAVPLNDECGAGLRQTFNFPAKYRGEEDK